jgi:hypothetical protein
MATQTKFNSLTEALAEKVQNFQSDTLKVMLCLTAPVVANSVKADLTEIAAGNGYTAGGNQATVVSSLQTSGTYKLILNDPSWTAAGGAIANFRYAVLYNDTATNKDLISFIDYGSTVTLNVGESFNVDFDGTNGALTIA